MKSIHRYLSLRLCLVVGALLLLTGAGVFLAMKHLLREQFDETLTAKARAIITASEIDDGEFEIDLTVQDFAGFGTAGSDYFEIRRLDGRLFQRSPSLAFHPGGLWEGGDFGPPRGNDGDISNGVFRDGRSARFYSQRFQPKDDDRQRFRDLYLIVASPDGAVHRQLAVLAVVLAIAGAAAIFLTIPSIRVGLARGMRPLERLTGDVAAIRPGNFGRGLDPTGYPEELAPVARRLNEWIARIGDSFERERRFSANAAHELRTPLAELRVMADLAATWSDEATPERCREMLAVISEIEALLEKLSLLGSAESGRHVPEMAGIDLEKSVNQAIARHDALAARRRIRIVPHVIPGNIRSDPVLWNAIVQNLIGNAVAHAPEGSAAVIEASPERLVVSNSAPNFESVDLDRMFEPFWRGDPSHASRSHVGLGLSIVKACAALLGANCSGRLDNGILSVAVEWIPNAADG